MEQRCLLKKVEERGTEELLKNLEQWTSSWFTTLGPLLLEALDPHEHRGPSSLNLLDLEP